MKISNIIIAFILVLFASCSGNQSNEHGHEHPSKEHGHDHAEGEDHDHGLEQEEFIISNDSAKVEESSQHTHDHESDDHKH